MFDLNGSFDDDMPSSLREMMKSSSHPDFFKEEGSKLKSSTFQNELSSSTHEKPGEEDQTYKINEDHPNTRHKVFGKSEMYGCIIKSFEGRKHNSNEI